ncbi:VWA domain-containing protein [uncultured Marinobacter sp.]|uniref:VWA domain-containing protein n=1 Tax=uncultured Marinobacter sp. TaxID=187379 RepID=UPI0030DC7840
MTELTGFHFLRPAWLLLLMLVPLVFWLYRQARQGDNGWSKVISPALLAPLQHGGQETRSRARQALRHPGLAPALLVVVISFALAGPSWRAAPMPLQQQDDALVIVLDLSLSMLATDTRPDRLTLAKRKIRDLLAIRDGAFTGLVVYAADAHTVTPLTDDRHTIEGLLAALDPLIMPAAGNRADLGIEKARSLLAQGAGVRGRILLITDGVPELYEGAVRRAMTDSPWPLYGLIAGTPEGGPVPLPNHGFIRDGDNVVITRSAIEPLRSLAAASGGSAIAMTTGDEDLAHLRLRSADAAHWHETRDRLEISRGIDDGYWLLWLLLPLIWLGWRRGTLATVVLAAALFPPRPALAWEWADLWQRPEQRAEALIDADPGAAADKLRDPLWQGTARFRNGQYDQAAEAFARGTGSGLPPAQQADAWYNRGNALIHAGKTEAAIEAWQQALTLDPDHDNARYNLELVEQQQENSASQPGEGDGEGEGEGEQGDQNAPPGGQADDPSNGPGTPPETRSAGEAGDPGGSRDDQPEATDSAPADEDANQHAAAPEESDGDPGDSSADPGANAADGQSDKADTNPLSQSQEQWLRRIPDDPGGLLRRKFLQQSRARNTQTDENDTPW